MSMCTGTFRGTTAALALAMMTLQTGSPAVADEAYARELFGKMSEYLGSQQALSFDYDASLDVVTDEGQRLTIASSGSVAMERPGNLTASRDGGFASVAFSFDGTTLTVLNRDDNVFAKADLPGSVDHLINELRDTYRRPLPAADLLLPDVEGALGPLFTDVKDLGSGVIRGVECDHLAFRTEGVDLQLWIAQGEAPIPCRYSVTSTDVEGAPGYVVDVYGWTTGTNASAAIAIEIPAGAQEVAPNEVPDLDDLAGIYAIEGAK